MARRRRFRDRHKATTQAEIKPKRGEHWQQRHERRLTFNIERNSAVALSWALSHGIELTITNKNHHWKFVRGLLSVQWWPSTAKCVLNEKWRQGIHVHDWAQLLPILTQHFEI